MNTTAFIKEMPALGATCTSKELKIENVYSSDENVKVLNENEIPYHVA